ncbi:AAA family ATPase [Chitinilyticum aquatile]|uniref:AAA family ATPase n=1 Tax=Chitinilyticum aquatile TaxID=362520 RepID=UPI00041AF849|nr:AAA family ATPase [Chitinilyticum aquatile]
MRILAIRGKNLASLSGEFAIDFTSEPLLNTGLFAISGPTGAGKSTLLDAMCLALFNDTPRLKQAYQLAGRSGALKDVGDETLNQYQTGNLLRRRCSEAWAEVDFLANDLQRYRAHWHVSRARGRIDGRLQNVQMSLATIQEGNNPDTGKPDTLQILSTQLSETLKEIEQRLGLTFDQFTRSVLLAQNEFSAFLKAKDDERANLLEALTGTEIYSRISMLAFTRNKDEEEKLALLLNQLAQGEPMTAEERTQLEQQYADAQGSLKQRQQELEHAGIVLQWFNNLNKLDAEQQQTLNQLAAAQQRQHDTTEQRTRLAQLTQASQARHLLSQHDVIEEQVHTNDAQQLETATALQEQQQQLQDANTAIQHASLHREQAQQSVANSQPELLIARELDTRIQHTRPQVEQANRHTAEAEQALLASTAAKDLLQSELSALQERITTTQTWLKENSNWSELANHWAQWKTVLIDAGQAQQEQTRLLATITTQQQTLPELQQQLAMADQEVRDRQALHQHCETSLRRSRQKLSDDPAVLLQQQSRITEQLEHAREALAIWSNWQNDQAEHATLLNQIHIGNETKTSFTHEYTSLQQQLQALEDRLRADIDALQQTRLASSHDVDQLRATLHSDQPCPVCGSTTHPYRESDPGIERVLTLAEAQVAQLETTINQLRVQQQQVAQNLARNEQQLEQLVKAEGLSKAAITASAQAWLTAGQPWHDIIENDRVVAIQSTIDQLQLDLATLTKRIDETLSCQREIDQLQQDVEKARQACEAATQVQARCQQAIENRSKEIAHQQDLLQRQESLCTKLMSQLVGAFSTATHEDWQAQWLAGPNDFSRDIESHVSSYLQHERELAEATQLWQQKQPELSGLQATMHSQQTQAQNCHRESAKLQSVLDELQQQRSTVLNGEDADHVEGRLVEEAQRAEQAHQQALQQGQAVREALKGVESKSLTLQQQSVQLQIQRHETSRALATWLMEQGLHSGIHDIATLRQLLTCDPAEFDALKSELETIDQTVRDQQTLLDALQTRRNEHMQHHPAEGSQTDWESRQETARHASETAMEQMLRLQHLRDEDDHRQLAAVSLRDTIEKQRQESSRWQRLNELIGSKDGKKFRNQAQQLTMDILLAHANLHMNVLNRRYRLERIPNNLALQIIDQDMGDEIRSVFSLSGGESFLVSLALALGLASLAAERMEVESLFIDEGFGSLDVDTLQVAMGALDTLQAQGRKVGVITHVQDMTERIEVQIRVDRKRDGASTVRIGQ